MKIDIPKGTYVVAVSGGVDSMVLLDVLRAKPDLDLVVAHFNHGIRPDSDEDERFVRSYCQKHGLAFTAAKVALGARASEAEARRARYEFLNKVKAKTGADAVITAHHKDDMLETAIINLLRGTEHKGLGSLKSSAGLMRPMLAVSKAEIIDYAVKHNIAWREDSTNQDQKYLRNYIRKNLLAKFSKTDLKKLEELILKEKQLASEIEPKLKQITDKVYDADNKQINRYEFTNLPFAIAAELMRDVLSELADSKVNKKAIKKAVHFVKTARAGKQLAISKKLKLVAAKATASFELS